MTIAQQLKIKDFPFEIKDKNGYCIYFENSNGYCVKYEYDTDGNWVYCEDSTGAINDNRPKTQVQKAIELLTKAGLLVDGKILNKL